jgi:hypothetical protein
MNDDNDLHVRGYQAKKQVNACSQHHNEAIKEAGFF